MLNRLVLNYGSRLAVIRFCLRVSVEMFTTGLHFIWDGRVGGDSGGFRPWHCIYVYSIESRLILRVSVMVDGNSNSTQDYVSVAVSSPLF